MFTEGANMSNELTAEDIMKAVEAIKNHKPYDLCADGHVVSPSAYQEGYGTCANCFAPVGDWSKAISND